MKLYIFGLFTLIFIFSTLAIPNYLSKRDDSGSVISIVSKLQCSENLKKLKECFEVDLEYMKSKDTNVYCNAGKNENCLNLYKNGVSSIDGCKDIGKNELELMDAILAFQYSGIKITCEKDENGNLCPLTVSATNALNSGNYTMDEDKFHNDTCKSQKCTELTIEYYTNSLKSQELYAKNGFLDKNLIQEDSNNKIKEGINKLKTCLNPKNSSSSDATTIKILGSYLLVTISLLYYFL